MKILSGNSFRTVRRVCTSIRSANQRKNLRRGTEYLLCSMPRCPVRRHVSSSYRCASRTLSHARKTSPTHSTLTIPHFFKVCLERVPRTTICSPLPQHQRLSIPSIHPMIRLTIPPRHWNARAPAIGRNSMRSPLPAPMHGP